MLRVIGRGAVTIIDGTHMVTNAHEARSADRSWPPA